MKKILLSMAVVIFAAFSVNAQSFTLSWDGETLGDTVTLTPDSSSVSELEFDAILNNLTNNGANIKVIRNEISMMGSSSSYFCWGACFPPNVDTSGVSMFIAADSSSAIGDFSAHYTINGAVGISIIEFTFYDVDNLDENVKVVVKFDTSLDGIDENILKNVWMSDVYPNPATNYVSIDYKLPNQVDNATVKIVNILGSVVKEQNVDIQNNSLSMDISNVKSGIYFYSLTVNGELYSTKKLIVR